MCSALKAEIQLLKSEHRNSENNLSIDKKGDSFKNNE